MRWEDLQGWRSQVSADFSRMGVEIRLARFERETSLEYVTEISATGKMQTVPRSQVGPPPMLLPEFAARALLAALKEHFGDPPNDFKARYEEARDALHVERARVDALLVPLSPPPERAL